MSGQMCWLPVGKLDGEKVLHIRTNSSESWRPYKACPQYAVADYDIPRGSRSLATYHELLQAGWILVSREQANQEFVLP